MIPLHLSLFSVACCAAPQVSVYATELSHDITDQRQVIFGPSGFIHSLSS